MKHSKHFSTRTLTPQVSPIVGREQDMQQNSAGGYSFTVDSWVRLRRFLILGSEGGTYYTGEKEMTVDNAKNVIACIKENGLRVVEELVEVSTKGLAPKNDPAIFTLALACTFGNPETKAAAYSVIRHVCRIGTHLFTFCEDIQALRGWSRGLRTGVSAFYTGKTIDELANQLVKYRQRNGWTHRDVFRLAHTSAFGSHKVDVTEGGQYKAKNELFRYAVGKSEGPVHPLIDAFEGVQAFCKEVFENKNSFSDAQVRKVVGAITDLKMTWEMLPTEVLAFPQVWEALLPHMPLTATLRNLGKMGSVGLLKPGADAVKVVLSKLKDAEALKKSRVHPMQIILALRTYSQGHGVKGSLSWEPVTSIVDALDEAFYSSFGNVESSGKRWLLGLDVSGSMRGSQVAGSVLSCAEACGAMSLITAAVEVDPIFVAFNTEAIQLPISRRQRLDDVVAKIRSMGGGTDCSAPIRHALKYKMPVDVFAIYTDSETWAGDGHPAEVLREYRRTINPKARMINIAMTATGHSIGDPDDPDMLEVVGFDASCPQIMAEFVKETGVIDA